MRIEPLHQSPTCLTWVPLGASAHEDAVLFGDDEGFVNLLHVSSKDLNPRQSTLRDSKQFSHSNQVDPKQLSRCAPLRRYSAACNCSRQLRNTFNTNVV